MGRINKDAAAPLVASICREKLWANPEETAEWLKTENGIREVLQLNTKEKAAPTSTRGADWFGRLLTTNFPDDTNTVTITYSPAAEEQQTAGTGGCK